MEKGEKIELRTVCAVINGGNKVDHRMRNNATFERTKETRRTRSSSAVSLLLI